MQTPGPAGACGCPRKGQKKESPELSWAPTRKRKKARKEEKKTTKRKERKRKKEKERKKERKKRKNERKKERKNERKNERKKEKRKERKDRKKKERTQRKHEKRRIWRELDASLRRTRRKKLEKSNPLFPEAKPLNAYPDHCS